MSNQQEEKRSTPVVRTLKPPPEIWELVQPVETRQFSPRLTLLTRLRLSATNLVLFAVVGGVVLGVCAAIFRFRAAEGPITPPTVNAFHAGATDSEKGTTKPTSSVPPVAVAPVAVAPNEGSVTQVEDVSVSDDVKKETARPIKRKPGPTAEVQRTDIASSETTVPGRSPAPKADQQTKAATETEKKTGVDPATAKPKATAALSPVVVAPPKPAPTPKAKVIQWP